MGYTPVSMKEFFVTSRARLIHLVYRTHWFFTRPRSSGAKVIVKSEGKYLLVRMSYHPDRWSLTGGGTEGDENGEETARREAREEVGLEFGPLLYVGAVNLPYHESKDDTVTVFFTELSGTPELCPDGKEIIEAGWFTREEFPTLSPNAQTYFELYDRWTENTQ